MKISWNKLWWLPMIIFLVFPIVLRASPSFYSEDKQDQYVYEHFFKGKKETGVFVDIGAHDGVTNSNSYFFEKHLGWKGVCFEASPQTYKLLRKSRKCQCVNGAVTSHEGTEKFIVHPCSFVSGLLSTYGDEHKKVWQIEHYLNSQEAKLIDVKCYQLGDYLLEQGLDKVDFLSIDTEGAEWSILSSIDFDRVEINVIVVENKYKDPRFQKFLGEKGYRYITRLHRDEVYKKKS